MSGHPKPPKGRARAGKLAFVLGGGGARGALQVGALRALYEAGYRPDVLVGTSIGAANAAFVAIHGFTPDALEGLEGVWRDAARRELLPASFLRLTARLLLGRPRQAQDRTRARIRAFLVAHGIDPALTFGALKVPLVLVATDLSRFEPVLYGRDPDAPVLEGLLASMAIPPWVAPLRVGDRLLMDGGLLSNLPIEPALSQGATRVIALSLADPRGADDGASPDAGGVGVGPLLTRMLVAVEYRQMYLEARLAKERGVPLFVLNLRAKEPVPIWDFRRAAALIEEGYEQARRQIARWPDALALTPARPRPRPRGRAGSG